MSEDQEPQLPPGDFSTLSTLSQTFSFHSSPESFISSRAELAASDPLKPQHDQAQIVRARILNRNVAVVTSHQICEDILKFRSGKDQNSFRAAQDGDAIRADAFAVCPAYHQLMSDFFPPPNILLTDPPEHDAKRELWDAHMSALPSDTSSFMEDIARSHFSTWAQGETVDLYDQMKDLSWRMLLGVFLQMSPSEEAYSTVESLQETLLRGQFSLFPVSVSTPFWRSPRSKGIESRKKLQVLLRDHINGQDDGCPFLRQGKVAKGELSTNVLLFTSSIAVKALASLLTATLLNIFLQPSEPPLVTRLRNEPPETRDILVQSILMETERLSPPVIGVMRRAQQDLVFSSPEGQPPTLVPAGWDIWLYFAGATRDPEVYTLPDKFVPERFVSPEQAKPGYAFGAGSKECLGRHVVRQAVSTIAKAALDSGISLEGAVDAQGVRGWLGWENGVGVDAFARDLKQLPCQRPKEAIHLRVLRGHHIT